MTQRWWPCFHVEWEKLQTCFSEQLVIMLEHHLWKCFHFVMVKLKHLNKDQVQTSLQGYAYLTKNLHANRWKRNGRRWRNGVMTQKANFNSIFFFLNTFEREVKVIKARKAITTLKMQSGQGFVVSLQAWARKNTTSWNASVKSAGFIHVNHSMETKIKLKYQAWASARAIDRKYPWPRWGEEWRAWL